MGVRQFGLGEVGPDSRGAPPWSTLSSANLFVCLFVCSFVCQVVCLLANSVCFCPRVLRFFALNPAGIPRGASARRRRVGCCTAPHRDATWAIYHLYSVPTARTCGPSVATATARQRRRMGKPGIKERAGQALPSVCLVSWYPFIIVYRGTLL